MTKTKTCAEAEVGFVDSLRQKFARWLLKGVHLHDVQFGENSITLSPDVGGGVKDLIRWTGSENAIALGDLGMSTTTGRPSAFIDGAVRALSHTQDLDGASTPYIVGPDALDPYSTISSAISAAVTDGASSSNPALILIKNKSSEYTENITLQDGIFLEGVSNGGGEIYGRPRILGKVTCAATSGLVSGLTNLVVGYATSVGGEDTMNLSVSGAGRIYLTACEIRNQATIAFSTSYALDFSGASASLIVKDCSFAQIGSVLASVVSITSAADVKFSGCDLSRTVEGTNSTSYRTLLWQPAAATGHFDSCTFQGVVWVFRDGATFSNCRFTSTTNYALYIQSTYTATAYNCVLDSANGASSTGGGGILDASDFSVEAGGFAGVTVTFRPGLKNALYLDGSGLSVTSPSPNDLLIHNGSIFVNQTVTTVAGNIDLGDLGDTEATVSSPAPTGKTLVYGIGGTEWDARWKTNASTLFAPTAGDDDLDGYELGSRWWVTSRGVVYGCHDATTATAIWEVIGNSATTYVVSKERGAKYGTIQGAISAAAATGDKATVVVGPGEWTENISWTGGKIALVGMDAYAAWSETSTLTNYGQTILNGSISWTASTSGQETFILSGLSIQTTSGTSLLFNGGSNATVVPQIHISNVSVTQTALASVLSTTNFSGGGRILIQDSYFYATSSSSTAATVTNQQPNVDIYAKNSAFYRFGGSGGDVFSINASSAALTLENCLAYSGVGDAITMGTSATGFLTVTDSYLEGTTTVIRIQGGGSARILRNFIKGDGTSGYGVRVQTGTGGVYEFYHNACDTGTSSGYMFHSGVASVVYHAYNSYVGNPADAGQRIGSTASATFFNGVEPTPGI